MQHHKHTRIQYYMASYYKSMCVHFGNHNKSLKSYSFSAPTEHQHWKWEWEWKGKWMKRKKTEREKNVFNLGDSWHYKLWVEPCTTVLLFFYMQFDDDALFKWHCQWTNTWTWANLDWCWVCVGCNNTNIKKYIRIRPTMRVNEEE